MDLTQSSQNQHLKLFSITPYKIRNLQESEITLFQWNHRSVILLSKLIQKVVHKTHFREIIKITDLKHFFTKSMVLVNILEYM